MATKERYSPRTVRKCAEVSRILLKEESKLLLKKVTAILKKAEGERSVEETQLLHLSPEAVKTVTKRNHIRDLYKQRQLEVEDSLDDLRVKCRTLVTALCNSKHAILYTGAGISTAASIPDYRGPNGVWTLLQQGIQPKAQNLAAAEPTYTHMAITKLHAEGLVKYVVSQNCDGLHLRSSLPSNALSEVHGNMFTEVCLSCTGHNPILRLYDVTSHTGLRRHRTGRDCPNCDEALHDTIVHFGEKGHLGAPHCWREAACASDSADLIICLGTSLKVLRKYACLWHSHKPASQRPKVCIVNLQWTPKDSITSLKLHGKCDTVMRLLMEQLSLDVKQYNICEDPLFILATPLRSEEEDSVDTVPLVRPEGYKEDVVRVRLQYYGVALPRTVVNNEDRRKRKYVGDECTNHLPDSIKEYKDISFADGLLNSGDNSSDETLTPDCDINYIRENRFAFTKSNLPQDNYDRNREAMTVSRLFLQDGQTGSSTADSAVFNHFAQTKLPPDYTKICPRISQTEASMTTAPNCSNSVEISATAVNVADVRSRGLGQDYYPHFTADNASSQYGSINCQLSQGCVAHAYCRQLNHTNKMPVPNGCSQELQMKLSQENTQQSHLEDTQCRLTRSNDDIEPVRSHYVQDPIEILSMSEQCSEEAGANPENEAREEGEEASGVTASVPGWFGKGLSVKRGRRKRQK